MVVAPTKPYPLHEKALHLSSEYRRLEKELIEVLQEIEEQRLYVELGFSSMFRYATESLGLSEANAYAFIAVARKAKHLPYLQQSLNDGSVSVSKVKHILAVLDRDNQKEWVEKAKILPKSEIEKQVAEISPESRKREKVHYIRKEALRMHLEVSEILFKKLKRAQDVSHSKNIEETLEAVLNLYLKSKDPVEKAKRVKVKKQTLPEKDPRKSFSGAETHNSTKKGSNGEVREKKSKENRNQNPQNFGSGSFSSFSLLSSSSNLATLPGNKILGRRPLSANVKYKIYLRDQGKCQFRGMSGKVCGNSKHLHLHHLQPVSQNGRDDAENLLTLCARHHDFFHRKDEKYLKHKSV